MFSNIHPVKDADEVLLASAGVCNCHIAHQHSHKNWYDWAKGMIPFYQTLILHGSSRLERTALYFLH